MNLHDLDWYSPRKNPHLSRIIPTGHLDTLSKPRLLNIITSLSTCLGKGGFDAHVWVTLLLDVIDIAMILVTYEPMKGVICFSAGPWLNHNYIWEHD
jgi:hypothetical protein